MKELHSTITIKGQVTIPVEIRRLLRVGPHDKVAFLVEVDQVRLAPATSVVARTAGVLKGDVLRLSPQEEKAAAEEAMAQDGRSRQEAR
ncbi:MAG: AbrB family transcriptional regulator [Chloroflexi bacterium]|nr:AbrB family transcriptional regulator [Chloroflexota bacterium]